MKSLSTLIILFCLSTYVIAQPCPPNNPHCNPGNPGNPGNPIKYTIYDEQCIYEKTLECIGGALPDVITRCFGGNCERFRAQWEPLQKMHPDWYEYYLKPFVNVTGAATIIPANGKIAWENTACDGHFYEGAWSNPVGEEWTTCTLKPQFKQSTIIQKGQEIIKRARNIANSKSEFEIVKSFYNRCRDYTLIYEGANCIKPVN